jgi:hypothetical protein
VDDIRPNLLVIVPVTHAALAPDVLVIARSEYPDATAADEVVDGQHRVSVYFRSEAQAARFLGAVRPSFRAYRPVQRDEFMVMLGQEVVATGGGGIYPARRVYDGTLERIDGEYVYLSGERVRVDQIAELHPGLGPAGRPEQVSARRRL